MGPQIGRHVSVDGFDVIARFVNRGVEGERGEVRLRGDECELHGRNDEDVDVFVGFGEDLENGWRERGQPNQHELVRVVGVSDSGGVVFSEESVAVLRVFVRGRSVVSDFEELEHHIDWDFVQNLLEEDLERRAVVGVDFVGFGVHDRAVDEW